MVQKKKGNQNKNVTFDYDCLKLLDDKCKSHEKIVLVVNPLFNLEKEKNRILKPLFAAHKGNEDWEKGYQSVKHDRYKEECFKDGNIKNLIHAVAALYLLNIYYQDEITNIKFSDIRNIDLSFGSSIFSLIDPSSDERNKILSNLINKDKSEINGSPFTIVYADDISEKIKKARENDTKNMIDFLNSQEELKDNKFQAILQELANNNSLNFMSIFMELYKYRINKTIPSSLEFEQRKTKFIESDEYNGKIRKANKPISENEITEVNLQAEIDRAGILAGVDKFKEFTKSEHDLIVNSNNDCIMLIEKK